MTRYEELNTLDYTKLQDRFIAMIEKEKTRGLTSFNASFFDKAYFGEEELAESVKRERLIGMIAMHEAYLAGEGTTIAHVKPRNKNDKL